MGCSFSNLSDDALNEFRCAEGNYDDTLYHIRETIANRRDLFIERYNAICIQRKIDEDYGQYFNRVILCVKRFKLSEISEDQFSALLALAGLARPEDERIRNVFFQYLIMQDDLQLQNVIEYVLKIWATEVEASRLENGGATETHVSSTQGQFKVHRRFSLTRGPHHQCSHCGHSHFVKHCIKTHHVCATIGHLSCECRQTFPQNCGCDLIGSPAVHLHSQNTQRTVDVFSEMHETSPVERHDSKIKKKRRKFERKSKMVKRFSRHYRTSLKFMDYVVEESGVYENIDDQVVPAVEANKETNSNVLRHASRSERRVRFNLPEPQQNNYESSIYHRGKVKRVQLNLNPTVTIY